MSPELWNQLSQQVPALIVLAWVVHKFVKHLERRDDMMETIGTECHRVQHDSRVALQDTQRALGEVTQALRQLNGRIKEQ